MTALCAQIRQAIGDNVEGVVRVTTAQRWSEAMTLAKEFPGVFFKLDIKGMEKAEIMARHAGREFIFDAGPFIPAYVSGRR